MVNAMDRTWIALAAVVTLLGGVGCASGSSASTTARQDRASLWLHPENPEWRKAAPPVSHIRFETTKGVFVLELVREWGPIGADRLYN